MLCVAFMGAVLPIHHRSSLASKNSDPGSIFAKNLERTWNIRADHGTLRLVSHLIQRTAQRSCSIQVEGSFFVPQQCVLCIKGCSLFDC
jgi:hypothetical protein